MSLANLSSIDFGHCLKSRTEMELASWISVTQQLFSEFRAYKSKSVKPPEKDDKALAQHILATESWSGEISMLGMVKSKSIESDSISLAISDQPRRFMGSNEKERLSEEKLIESGKSCVLLGDPGSGKTTTMKRLARRLITRPHEIENDIFDFPIVIFGRDIDQDSDLFDLLFKTFGFSLRNDFLEQDDSSRQWAKLKDVETAKAVSSLLMEAKVALFIDGIDEADIAVRSKLVSDMQKLADIMMNGRVFASCRSGDWNYSTPFNIYEICPLEESDISSIVDAWSKNPDDLKAQLSGIAYRDLLDRPIFLCMVVIIHDQIGSLPEQSIDVYTALTNLMIEKWDSQRGIRRQSKYDDFQHNRKYRFLCSLSYETLIVLGAQRFDSHKLKAAYSRIHRSFGLPAEDADYVVQELEGHTGLIVQSGFGHFEFSHLTIQEFLAADHLVGMSTYQQALSVLKVAPGVAAVATSLSSNPSVYLGLLLNTVVDLFDDNRKEFDWLARNLPSMFSRLELEKPVITGHETLGLGLLRLEALHNVHKWYGAGDAFDRLKHLEGFRESVVQAGNRLDIRDDKDYVEFKGTSRPFDALGFVYDLKFRISTRRLFSLLK